MSPVMKMKFCMAKKHMTDINLTQTFINAYCNGHIDANQYKQKAYN